jgi:hypothetical protein
MGDIRKDRIMNLKPDIQAMYGEVEALTQYIEKVT